MKRIWILYVGVLLLGFPSKVIARQLVVNVSSIPPCAIFCDDRIAGFSIDLWERCAEYLGWDYRYNQVIFKDKLPMVMNGEADVAIAGISITEDREKKLDFSLPTLNSGLRIMVCKSANFLPTLSSKSKKMILFLLIFLGIFGHILWFSERNSPAIDDRYFPGIFEAFWCVFATMTTVGYGDIVPKKWIARLMAVLIMFTGIALFGIIIATLTADLITEKQVANINDHKDLMGMTVGTKLGTTSVNFLKKYNVKIRSYPTIEEACEALRKGQVSAVVYDEPTLLYFSKTNSGFMPVGESFAKQYYGFAFPEGSELVEPFNLALLKLKENGEYDRIYGEWFDLEDNGEDFKAQQ